MGNIYWYSLNKGLSIKPKYWHHCIPREISISLTVLLSAGVVWLFKDFDRRVYVLNLKGIVPVKFYCNFSNSAVLDLLFIVARIELVRSWYDVISYSIEALLFKLLIFYRCVWLLLSMSLLWLVLSSLLDFCCFRLFC